MSKSLNIFLAFVFIFALASCGTKVNLELPSSGDLTPEQEYRSATLGNSQYSSSCISAGEISYKTILYFQYYPDASLYRVTSFAYSGEGCNEADLMVSTEDITTLNASPNDRQGRLVIDDIDNGLVEATLGTYVYSQQTAQFHDDAKGLGATTLSNLQASYPDDYPASIKLGDKISVAGKPFMSAEPLPANGDTNYLIMYANDDLLALNLTPDPLDLTTIYDLDFILYK